MIINNIPNVPQAILGSIVDWASKLTQALKQFSAQDLVQLTIFPGFVIPWERPTVRDDSWYFLEGQLLQIANDKGLYQVYGNTYSLGGDAAGTFRLPTPSAQPWTGAKWMVKR